MFQKGMLNAIYKSIQKRGYNELHIQREVEFLYLSDPFIKVMKEVVMKNCVSLIQR